MLIKRGSTLVELTIYLECHYKKKLVTNDVTKYNDSLQTW